MPQARKGPVVGAQDATHSTNAEEQGPAGTVPSVTQEELSAATHHYSKACLIGSGGFGKVYRAYLPGLGPAAIKIANNPLDCSLEKEIMVLCRYHHPCIVQLIGCCWTAQTKALVYELMAAGNLDDILEAQHAALHGEDDMEGQRRQQQRKSKRQKQHHPGGEQEPGSGASPAPAAPAPARPSCGTTSPQTTPPGHKARSMPAMLHVKTLTWQDIIRVTYQVASALAYLHGCVPAVVHRDIKPGNILLDEHLNAKLADVGIAKVVPDAAAGAPSRHPAAAAAGRSSAHPSIIGHAHSQHVGLVHTAARGGAASAAASGAHGAAACPSFLSADVAGTNDYLDPLYAQLHQLSPASDVYGLGLVMCQLVLGRNDPKASKNVLKHWSHDQAVREHLPAHLRTWPRALVSTYAALAVQCASHERHDRPPASTVRDTLFKLYVEAELGADPAAGAVLPGQYCFEGVCTTHSAEAVRVVATATSVAGTSAAASVAALSPPTGHSNSNGNASQSTGGVSTAAPAAALARPVMGAWGLGSSTIIKPKPPGSTSSSPQLHMAQPRSPAQAQLSGPQHGLPPSPGLNQGRHGPPASPDRQQQQQQQQGLLSASARQAQQRAQPASAAPGSQGQQQVSAVLELDSHGAVKGHMYVVLPDGAHDAPELACPVLDGSYEAASGSMQFRVALTPAPSLRKAFQTGQQGQRLPQHGRQVQLSNGSSSSSGSVPLLGTPAGTERNLHAGRTELAPVCSAAGSPACTAGPKAGAAGLVAGVLCTSAARGQEVLSFSGKLELTSGILQGTWACSSSCGTKLPAHGVSGAKVAMGGGTHGDFTLKVLLCRRQQQAHAT